MPTIEGSLPCSYGLFKRGSLVIYSTEKCFSQSRSLTRSSFCSRSYLSSLKGVGPALRSPSSLFLASCFFLSGCLVLFIFSRWLQKTSLWLPYYVPLVVLHITYWKEGEIWGPLTQLNTPPKQTRISTKWSVPFSMDPC